MNDAARSRNQKIGTRKREQRPFLLSQNVASFPLAFAVLILLTTPFGNTFLRPVMAFPTAAGGCDGGQPAIGGNHLDPTREIINGTLEDYNITIQVGNQILSPNTVTTIVQGEPYEIKVEAPEQIMRGILIRLEAPADVDTTAALIPGARTQIAEVCEAPIVGLCHFRNNPKLTFLGTMELDAIPGQSETYSFSLDVTVVFRNWASLSWYAYTGYQLQAEPNPETLPPTNAPSDMPSDVPSDMPSDVPSTIPSDSPSLVPTASFIPTSIASEVPTITPSGLRLPTSSPNLSTAPTPALTTAPTPAPTPICPAQAIAMQQCFTDSLGDELGRICDQCVADNIPGSATSCQDLSDQMCFGINICPCGDCKADIATYIDCVFLDVVGCGINCGFTR